MEKVYVLGRVVVLSEASLGQDTNLATPQRGTCSSVSDPYGSLSKWGGHGLGRDPYGSLSRCWGVVVSVGISATEKTDLVLIKGNLNGISNDAEV